MGRHDKESTVKNAFGRFDTWNDFVGIYYNFGSVFATDSEKHVQYLIMTIKPTFCRTFDQDNYVPQFMWEHERLSWYHGEYVCFEECSSPTRWSCWLVQNPRANDTLDKSPSRYT